MGEDRALTDRQDQFSVNGPPDQTSEVERSVIRPAPVMTPFGIRRGERREAWLFFAYFFVLACSQYAVKSVRQATFVDSWGAEQLPWVYLALAVVSFPVLLLYTRAANRYRLHRIIIGFCIVHGLILVAFFELLALPSRWVPVAFYLWSTVGFGVAVSQLWSYAGTVFDARQARRLFAFVGAGGLLGGIPGGLIARMVSGRWGTYSTLLISGVLFVSVAAIVLLIERGRPVTVSVAARPRALRSIDDARGGFRTILGSKLLEMIALMLLLTMMAAQMVDLQFNWAIQSATQGLDHRTSVYGGFFSVMGLVGFLFQIVFTRRLHRGLGVGASMRVLPVTVAMTTVILIAAVGFVPGIIVGAAWLMKLGEGGLRHSVDQATRELLFLPVPPKLRRRGKAFIDVFVQRFGKGVAAVLLLPVSFGWIGMQHVAVMTLVVVLVWLVIAESTRREYVGAFRQGLKSGNVVDPEPVDLENVASLSTLIQGLGSSDARTVIHSLDLLADHGMGRLVTPLLMHHDDPGVRSRTVDVLASEQRQDTIPVIEQAIADRDPVVRRKAIEALATLKQRDAAVMMEERLQDSDPRMRAAAVAFVLNLGRPEAKERARSVLEALLRDPDWRVRREGVKALGYLDEEMGEELLIQVFYDAERMVVREAIRSARQRQKRGHRCALSIPVLIALMGDRGFKHEAREAIVAHGDRAVDSLVMFMNSPDEQIWVRRAIPKTMARMGGPRAVQALMDNLEVGDSLLRSKVIESLATLRRRNRFLKISRDQVKGQIRQETIRYLESLADLATVSALHHLQLVGPHARWKCGGRTPTLLQQFLARRMHQCVDNVFHLLELIHKPDDIRAAARSLQSRDSAMVARALEYLDNRLHGSVRKDVFSVIEDLPVLEKVRNGIQQYDCAAQCPEEMMVRLLKTDLDRDPDAVGLVMGALHDVVIDDLRALLPQVEALADRSTDALVREAAEWVGDTMKRKARLGRLGGRHPTELDSDRLENGKDSMTEMTRIEMMVFLQGVDVFSYCDADQMLRLAAITKECSFDADEVIFGRGTEADALYCVVEGRVHLIDGGGSEEWVGPQGRFGVNEILGGCLRDRDAVAEGPVRVLAIEAEDFFDLLSNNIEIVKALFRQLSGNGLARRSEG